MRKAILKTKLSILVDMYSELATAIAYTSKIVEHERFRIACESCRDAINNALYENGVSDITKSFQEKLNITLKSVHEKYCIINNGVVQTKPLISPSGENIRIKIDGYRREPMYEVKESVDVNEYIKDMIGATEDTNFGKEFCEAMNKEADVELHLIPIEMYPDKFPIPSEDFKLLIDLG